MNKEILESNKLIAEFMGFKPNNTTSIEVLYNEKTCEVLENDKLLYHSSWDWLMPVIDKITSMNAYIKYKDHSSSQFSDGGIYINTKFIDNTHNDVVDFIKWYNTQEK